MRRSLAAVLVLLGSAEPLFAADQVDYLRDIKPIFSERCGACHGALKQEADLRLDTGASVRRGSSGGRVVEPGDAGASRLIERVTAEDEFERMPPEGRPLTAEQIDLLRAWINQGAESPEDEAPEEDPRSHWSYQPPQRPAVPEADAAVRNPIDAFLAAEHERHGLVPVPPADKATLLRRVTLDLTGVPPTRAELHAFLADERPDAYERVVDRLLESPRYGERWGRHWMDVWRYSDWYGVRAGNQVRYSQPHIWRWRDWIVESLNADKGYDRMVVEMLAGDEAAPADQNVLRATGFLARNWYMFNRNSWLQETVEHTALGFLGLSLKCARCHDHMFDPVSQEEYYRFRAFFEPHDVRTDQVPGEPDVTQDGLARVYDKALDAPTYLFQRGDDRRPIEDRPLTPGVPDALGAANLRIEPIALPYESYYPVLQPHVAQTLIDAAEAEVRAAEVAVGEADETLAAARRTLAKADAASADEEPAEPAGDSRFVHEDFAESRPEFWKIVSGQWEHREGRLVQTAVTNFATIASVSEHPQDFRAHLRYRTTEGGSARSVGLSFDMVDGGNSQDVYTSANDNRPTVQAFHRQDGQQVYPQEAIVPCDVKVGQEIALEITVRGQQLQIAVDGELKLDYVMPVPRRAGRLALWVHNGTAEFLELNVEAFVPTRADLARHVTSAEFAARLARQKVETARAERDAVQARIAAERARHAQPQPIAQASATCPGIEEPESAEVAREDPATSDADCLARQASGAERRIAVRKAEEALLEAERQVAAIRAARPADEDSGEDSGETPALAEAEKRLDAARAAVADAEAAIEQAGTEFTPLGTPYPTTSTGRRLALARWIADPDNPRTARVAVNHVWLRHFGRGLVANPAEFGLRTESPSHPELLDWLAVEFAESGWSLKHLHRLIVTSAAYQRSSSADRSTHSGAETSEGSATAGPQGGGPNAIDPENRFLWRMNSRRMEAEVVRDSILFAAGGLDAVMGGPDLDETLGQTSGRRSLYFRITPDNSMEFLDLFDMANPNECYERRESVVPQQALALGNSVVSLSQSRLLARDLPAGSEDEFITAAFEQVLTRRPTEDELSACRRFLERHAALLEDPAPLSAMPPAPLAAAAPSPDPKQRARENLVHVLFSHNDFVTIR